MKSPTGPDLCHCLAARRSGRYLTRIYDRHLAPSGLSCSQFSLLALVLAHPAISIAALSTLMVMERTTLLRALKPLREQRYLVVEAQGAKGTMLFSLSLEGGEKVKEAESYWQVAQREFEKETGKQRAALLRSNMLEMVFRD